MNNIRLGLQFIVFLLFVLFPMVSGAESEFKVIFKSLDSNRQRIAGDDYIFSTHIEKYKMEFLDRRGVNKKRDPECRLSSNGKMFFSIKYLEIAETKEVITYKFKVETSKRCKIVMQGARSILIDKKRFDGPEVELGPGIHDMIVEKPLSEPAPEKRTSG